MTHRDLTLDAYEWLKREILNFRKLPGVRVSDKEIAEQLGMSRSPVREALGRLAEQGLLESRYNRGFTVKIFSIREVEDLYTLRAELEGMAVRLATRSRTLEIERDLQKALDELPLLIQAKNFVGFNDADEQFHERIAVFSGNAMLADVLKNLQGRIRLARRYQHLNEASFQETFDEHHEIFHWMQGGEAARAKRAMTDHILRSMKYIVSILKSNQSS